MLNQLKWKFVRFMYGRYGIDKLNTAILIFIFTLQVIQILIRNSLLNAIVFILFMGLFYRVFSKNIYARQKENQKFMEYSHSVASKWNLLMRRVKEIRTHRYRTCSECNTILRLPIKRGHNKTRCPKCKNTMDVRIYL